MQSSLRVQCPHDTDSQGRSPIVYNAMSARTGGGLSYAVQEVSGLPDQRSIVILTSPFNSTAFSDALESARIIEARFSHPALRVLFEQLVVPFIFDRSVLLYPGNFAPLIVGRKRTCLVIQNMNYFGVGRHRATNQALSRRFKVWLSQASVQRAGRVVSISRALSEQILIDIPEVASKLREVPSGRPIPTEPGPALVKGNYVLSIANDYPHKDLDGLASSWDVVASCRPDLNLVFVGEISPDRRQQILESVQPSNRARVMFLGAIRDKASIATLYSFASVAVSTSRLEAHPLTPAEAGSYGTPIVLSDIPAHREVAADHATYVDTEAPASEWAAAITRACEMSRRPWSLQPTWDERGEVLAEVLDLLGKPSAPSSVCAPARPPFTTWRSMLDRMRSGLLAVCMRQPARQRP